MKVGLFFGSFNPIHTGHLIIANTVLNELPLTEVWFVVSPQNPLKKSPDLLDAAIRFQLTAKAIASDTRLKASDVEFNLPLPSYSIDTLTQLGKLHPENEFHLILGSDSFLSLDKWKGYKEILQMKLVVYQRPGYSVPEQSKASNITLLTSPLLEISATTIRQLIKNGKSIRYFVPDVVRAEIEKNNYYK